MSKKINICCRIIGILMSASILCAALSGCGESTDYVASVTVKTYDETAYSVKKIDSGIIVQNTSFSLEWDNESKSVGVKDLKSGVIYSAMPSGVSKEVRYDEDGLPIKNNPLLESAVNVTYYESETASEGTMYSSNEAVKNGNVYAEIIDNGIRVIYDFSEKRITVPVDYTIGEEGFKISVDTAEISEDEFMVTGIAIAPFMCGIENDSSNGYLFVPDGSGAVIEPETIDTVGSNGSIAVYGGDYAKKDDDFESYTEQCYMPVFGVKSGNSGLCAIIESSAERSYINWSVGSSNIQYSSVYPYFRIRSYNDIKSPVGIVGYSRLMFNESITDEELCVAYYPIYGENCGYNDMADIYRNYLIANYGLSENESEEVKLSLEIEGGMSEKKFFCGVPYTGFTSLTTIKQTDEIIRYFEDYTDDLLVRLCGFTESGLDVGKVAGGFKINSALGSKSEISELTDYCREKGVVLSLDFDLISFNKGGNGYSIDKSSTLFSNNQVGYINMVDNVTRNTNGTRIYLLSRSSIGDALKTACEKTENYGFDTIGIGKLGKFIYSDFGSEKTYNCNNIQEDVAEFVNSIPENKAVVMTGANDYAAAVCDYIVGAPTSSSAYDVFDYDVPFYSMVFKGYIPMSSGAINLAVDEDEALLRCVEAGISPSYTLLYDFSRSVVTSNYAVTRSSEFYSVREDITAAFEKTGNVLSAISGAGITAHRVISDELRSVSYANGVTVYINYGDTDAVADGITVGAKNYAVSEG